MKKKMEGSKSSLAGMEVPIIGSDSVSWIEVSVPSSSSSSDHNTIIPLLDDVSTATDNAAAFAPLTEDCASCSVIGDPPLYLIWRIHNTIPHALEILQLSADEEFPTIGLRINFPVALSPFAFIFKNEISSTHRNRNLYWLYVLTVSGVAYRLKLSNVYAYASCSVFPRDDLIEFDIRAYSDKEPITSVAALLGCLVVGRSDGSVACFQLGMLHQTAPGFAHELRDDSGIGRLWGFISRGRMVAAVQDMVISEVHKKKLLFVLHADGIVRVWDLLCYSRIFYHSMTVPTLEGATSLRLWVGEVDLDSSIIPLAVLYRCTVEVSIDMINVYSLHCSFGDRLTLSLESKIQNIPLEQGGCIDVKLTSDKLWLLKDNGLVFHKLFHTNTTMEEAHCYALQEEFVADQLFQSSEHSSDDLLLITHSISSSAKDQIIPFVSYIFLRRLLHPGVFNNIVLRSTLLVYNKHWTDSEFQSLTLDGLKKELLSLVEHEGVAESSISVFYWWKNFCACYFNYWCKNNEPYGLLVQSSADVVGLIRKNSVSLVRGLENIELLVDGSSDELDDLVNFGLDLSDDEQEILVEVLRCITSISQQLGKTASAIFYESLVGKPIISSEEIVPRLLKILEMGYNSSVALLNASDLGADIAWEKQLADHKNLRKFSIDMLLSLHAVCKRAISWRKVLNVIESYLQFLVPQKIIQNFDAETLFSISSSILVQASSQIAKVMFESAFDIFLFLSYLVNISGQINMLHDDMSRIQLELIPMIQEIVSEWLIILFFGTTPSESPSIEDFSSQLSSLQIDSNVNKRSWNKKLGKCDFTLAFVLLLNSRGSSGDQSHLSLRCLPNPQIVISLVRNFTSWIIWGKTGQEASSFLRRSTELALSLFRNGQYDAVEYLLTILEANSRREKIFRSIQDSSGDWCLLQHLLGCCLLAQAQRGLRGVLRERKVWEAVRCFFRASSGGGAFEALQSLSNEAGLPHIGFNGSVSSVAWKLHYYEWAMQIFEQYNISEGSCKFALAALEQVDEALSLKDDSNGRDPLNESATTIKGRLWANVFKFALDLNLLNDAYCAIISNPDEESKYICLRRFTIVLYERGGMKILCDGQLPFIGLTEKIERELAWKAGRSDILAKPNPYKLLYSFEMHRHNWRRAASYMYQYSARLRTEPVFKDFQHVSLALQERLNGLSAAINALHFVHPAYAWIDPLPVEIAFQSEHYPSKKARKTVKDQPISSDGHPLQSYIDIEKLQNEFVLTSAEYLLSLANVKWRYYVIEKPPSDLVDLLVQTNLYDMAFTVLLTFWKGSGLKRELEKVFTAMALKCCPSKVGSVGVGSDFRSHNLLLTASEDEVDVGGSPDIGPTIQNSKATGQWETLELYLERYKGIHARLPVVVAEMLLRADPQIELPLWLVHMFKGGQRERTFGMTGQESSPVALFQLYVNHGRYTEATNLLIEYIESFASVRPADIINRKRPFAIWFPYTTIERLWCHLEELISLGHMVDQCNKLKKLLHGALLNHLKLLKVDSDDAVSAVS